VGMVDANLPSGRGDWKISFGTTFDANFLVSAGVEAWAYIPGKYLSDMFTSSDRSHGEPEFRSWLRFRGVGTTRSFISALNALVHLIDFTVV